MLVGDRGAYRLAHPLDTLQVPATVQALLAARIDRLPSGDKRLLQTAAVIGTEVPGPLLQAIADTADEALYRGLAQLQATEFLYETSLFPERSYTFKHALTHEVAYGSLLHERRRALHAQITQALEVLAGDRLDDQVERLAHHALRGEVWEKALVYGRQAGDKAQARSAYREAVVCYEQALTVLAHLPASRAVTAQAIDLRLGLRNALNPLAEEPERMLGHLRRAETLAQALGDQQRLGRVYAAMSATFWVAGEVDRAIDYGQQTLVVAATLGHVGLQTQAHHVLGHAYADAGDYGRAIESYAWNVGMLQGDLLYERSGATGSIAASCRAWLSLCHTERGAFTQGLALAEEGLRIAELVQSPFSQLEACQGVSAVYLRQGDVQRALPVLERAVGLCQDWHIPLLWPIEVAILGLAYVLDGRSDAGLALVEQGVEQQVARSRRRRLAYAILCLSEAYLLTGRLVEAHTRAVQALDLARQYQQRGNQAWALWLLGESTAHQASPELAPAAGHYRQALALAEELGMRPLQAHCHRGLGTLYAASGQREQVRAELAVAMEMYQSMDMTFWLPETEAALAQVEGR
jgi:tetratricopeptide (TPR) repeat protein